MKGIAIIALFVCSSALSAYCNNSYCVDLPPKTIVVNQDNWEDNAKLISQPIRDKYKEGSTKEIWFINDYDVTVIVDYSKGRINIDTYKICDFYREKLSEDIIYCSAYRELVSHSGVQIVEWPGPNEISRIRFLIQINGGYAAMVCTGVFKNTDDAWKTLHKLSDIIQSIRVRH